MICKRCNQEGEPHNIDGHLCVPCVKAENSRVSFLRTQNHNWLEVAAEADLQPWERQPAETDHEWNVWLHYRDAYPGKRPSYKGVAEELITTVNAVRKIGSRWTFPARLQAWAKHIDEITLVQRQQEILDMNKQHVDMAVRLNEKISKAIDLIDPFSVSPREISSLIKTATELERKGRMDQVVVGTGIIADDNPELNKTQIKSDDIGEIMKILSTAGVMGDYGVKQTVTTEVVVKGDVT